MADVSDWKRFDYHEPPPGTEIEPGTGRLRRSEKDEEDEARTNLAYTREEDPDVVLRVSRSVVSEAKAVLDSLCFEYRLEGTRFVFPTADERRLAESVLEPIGTTRTGGRRRGRG